MNIIKAALSIVMAITASSALAEIKPVASGSQAETVAAAANQIVSVTNLKIGKFAYKIVSMDSILSGDTSLTTILLVGEGAVGGEAGYDAAFQLSPSAGCQYLKSAQAVKGSIHIACGDINGKTVINSVQYNPSTKILTGMSFE